MRSARSCSSRLSVATRVSTLPTNSISYRSNNVIRSSSRIVSRNSPLLTFGSRKLWTEAITASPKSRILPWLVGIVAGVATATTVLNATSTNWDAVRDEIKSILHDDKHDDGHYGPILVRLAWHAAGTYVHETRSGGSNGATMRYGSEAGHGANKGLHIARDLLEKVKKKHPEVSYADLWTLAGCVAIEEMGGPHIPWRSGRVDHPDETRSPPEGRLPDASKDRHHIKEVFYRMGFNDQEIVALLGAHAIGRCHTDRSGYHGPWTTSPTTFTNNFYVHLLNEKWTLRKWDGPKQYQDETGTLMMLPTDIELGNDPGLKKYVVLYANDEEQFFRDFAKAFSKLIELGVEFPVEPLEKVAPKGTPTPKQQEEAAKEGGWRSWLGLGGDKKKN